MSCRHCLLIVPILALAACDNAQTPPPAAQTESVPAASEAVPPAAAPAPPAAEPEPTAAAVSGSPATAEQIAPMVGLWAADLSWCGPGGAGTPITISETRFEGAENSCAIAGFFDKGDGSFDAPLTCVPDGFPDSEHSRETLNLTPLFAPTGEGVKIHYLDRAGSEPVVVLRCD